MSKLYLNSKLKTSLSFPMSGFNNLDELISECIKRINLVNPLLNVDSYDMKNVLEEENWNTDSTYFGYVKENTILAYFCLVPPNCARNGFINQYIMPALLRIYQTEKHTIRINSRSVYILDMADAHTKTMLLAIANYKKVNYNYINLMDIDLDKEYLDKNVPMSFDSLKKLDDYLIQISRTNSNEYFDLDSSTHIIKFKKNMFKSSSSTNYFESLTNEPYYYCGKIFLILDLVMKEKWEIDLTDFDSYNYGSNVNVDSLLDYLNAVKEMKVDYMQKIYYGAPGTGKSYEIDKLLKNVSDDRLFRVTFYPEFTYSDFVGQIMPVKTSSGFDYNFVPGEFFNALKKAYENTNEDVYLIIEEISRGKAAAIFGDLFQLLDREKNGHEAGYSRYGINNDIISSRIPQLYNKKVKLPPCFHIIGTLNTSDQNVYPLDTAFKRRFDWEYISTEPKEDANGNLLNNFEVSIIKSDGSLLKTKWCNFYQALNKFIVSKDYLELGEDKQIGQFFVESDNLSKKDFANKVLFYLWNDIALNSYKGNVSLFSNTISSFADLINKYLSDKCVFSEQFTNLL